MSRWPITRSHVRTRSRPACSGATRGGTSVARVSSAAILVFALVAPAGAAHAVEAPEAPLTTPLPQLLLASLDAIVGPVRTGELPEQEGAASALPDADFSARLLIDNITADQLVGARVVVELHDLATSRSTLRAALDGTTTAGPGRLLADLPLAAIAAGDVGQLELIIDGASGGFVDPNHDVSVRPLVISLVRGSAVLNRIQTAVIGVARQAADPLETTVVWPIDGPATSSTSPVADRAASLQPGGRVDRLVRAVELAGPGVATLAPAAHTMEDLQLAADAVVPGAGDVLARLIGIVEAAPSGTVSSPYALADVPALAGQPSTEVLAGIAIAEGRRRLQQLTQRAPSAAHLVTAPQTPTSLDLVPVDVLVARWDSAAGIDLNDTPSADIPPALRTAQAPSGRALRVLVADPWIERALADPAARAQPILTAHRVLVEAAMTFAEQPGVGGRTLAIVPPHGWHAEGGVATELLSELRTAPWLRFADPVTLVARADPDVRAGWAPNPTPSRALEPVLGQLGSLLVRFEGLRSAVAELPDPPPVTNRGDDLLRAATTWPDGDRTGRARQLLNSVSAQVEAAIGGVVIPDDNAITLTAERGVIPVTVQHPEGVPMDVVIDVTTQGRLSFQNGSSRSVNLPAGGTATVSFEALALGRGTFPLAVTVRTPGEGVVLARALVSVRATAVSRPALIAIGIVVLLLVALGRRRKKPTLQVVR